MDTTLWERRELPILQAIDAAGVEGGSIDSDQIVDATELEVTAVGRAHKALIDADYVSGIDTTTMADPAPTYMELELKRLGREAVGSWQPSTASSSTANSGSQVILEVLIASPSDTTQQRDAIERAIHDWNGLHAIEFGVVLLPRRWERDTYPTMGASPQQIVNRQIVDRSAILVGVFWTRLGTRTDDADSGTAEEIERFIAAGRPAHLYFSNQPAAPGTIDTDQLDRLNAYKSALRTKGLLGSFDTTEDLERQVQAALTRDVRDLRDGPTPRADGPPSGPTINVTSEAAKSGHTVTVANAGATAANRVRVQLTGGLFMLNSAREKIGDSDGFLDYDDVGMLTPGSSRQYIVMTAWQSPEPKITVTAADMQPLVHEL